MTSEHPPCANPSPTSPSATNPRCYIILVNWNGCADTLACLESLCRLQYPDVRIIVCDNSSSDNSLDRIRSWAEYHAIDAPVSEERTNHANPLLPLSVRSVFYDEHQPLPPSGDESLVLIQTGSNRGFAGANNIGIRYAMSDPLCEFVWLLNNDTVVEARALSALVGKAMTDPRIGAVGSVCYFASDPGLVQCWGGARVSRWTGYVRTNTMPRPDDWFDYVYGASLLARREAIEDAGLIDEAFFLYYEEAEFCLRMRQRGWRMAIAPDSKLWHKVNASTGGDRQTLDRYSTPSGLRFLSLHAPAPCVAMPLFVASRIAKRILRGEPSRVRDIVRAVRDYAAQSHKPLRSR